MRFALTNGVFLTKNQLSFFLSLTLVFLVLSCVGGLGREVDVESIVMMKFNIHMFCIVLGCMPDVVLRREGWGGRRGESRRVEGG